MSKLDVGRIRGRNAAGTLSDRVGCCWDCAGVLSVGSLSFLLIRDVLEGSSTGGLSTILHAHLEPSCADISTLNSTASTFQSPSGPAARPLQSLFSRLSPRSFFPLHYFLADFLQTKWSTFLSEFRHGGTIRKSGLDCAATDVCYCTGFLRFFAARASVGPHLPDLVFRQLVSPTFRHTFFPVTDHRRTRRTYCKHKTCKKHTPHKVTQYKKGKDSLSAQGKRRYDRKQSGYGGQTKPVFHKKAKTVSHLRAA